MATRKRARTDEGQFQADDPNTPEVNEAWVEDARSLADFMELETADGTKLGQALQLARATAAEFIGGPLPQKMTHELRMGLNLLASQLLLRNQLRGPVDPATIPLVARYYFRLAARAQG